MGTIDFKFKVLRLFRDQFSKMTKRDFDAVHNSFEKHSTNGYILTLNDLIDSIANVKSLKMDKIYLKNYFNDCNINTQKDFIEYNYNYTININTKNKNNSKSLGIIFYPGLLSALLNGSIIDVQERLWAKFTQLDDDRDGQITIEQLIETLKTHDNLNEYDQRLTVEFIQVNYTHILPRHGTIYFKDFLNEFYLHDFCESEENKWKIERIIWIGYEKNIDNDKCLIAKLPKDLVKKCLSFVSSRLWWQTIVISNLTK